MATHIYVPEGWVVVPIKPTQRMLQAGEETFVPCYTGTPVSSPKAVWQAMIEKAPKPKRRIPKETP
jgi:hypothetical protein